MPDAREEAPIPAAPDTEKMFRDMCVRLRACVVKHNLGLGGEYLDELVVNELDRMKAAESQRTPVSTLTEAVKSARDSWQAEHGCCTMCDAGDKPVGGLHRGKHPCGNSEPFIAQGGSRKGFKAERSCCTVCDRKKVCHICGAQTLYACSDCCIDFGVSIYVCQKYGCQIAHENKCSAELRRRQATYVPGAAAQNLAGTQAQAAQWIRREDELPLYDPNWSEAEFIDHFVIAYKPTLLSGRRFICSTQDVIDDPYISHWQPLPVAPVAALEGKP